MSEDKPEDPQFEPRLGWRDESTSRVYGAHGSVRFSITLGEVRVRLKPLHVTPPPREPGYLSDDCGPGSYEVYVSDGPIDNYAPKDKGQVVFAQSLDHAKCLAEIALRGFLQERAAWWKTQADLINLQLAR